MIEKKDQNKIDAILQNRTIEINAGDKFIWENVIENNSLFDSKIHKFEIHQKRNIENSDKVLQNINIRMNNKGTFT